jgi:hypothetical protein
MRRSFLVVGLIAATAGGGLLATRPAAAETLVQTVDFETPGLTWSGLMLPWGGGGFFDWVIADGGHPGKALRITNKDNGNAVACECRTLMFNHEPGTPVRVQLDLKPASHPKGAAFVIRWYDGYVTADAFERIASDEFDPFPAPVLQITDPPKTADWQHVDFQTPPLQQTVLTLWFEARQPPDPDKQTQDTLLDYYLDNLRVESTPLSKIMDPGFDWHGQGGGDMVQWRWSTAGKHVDWCNFMDDVKGAPLPNGGTIDYTLATFRDTGAASRPGNMSLKHEYAHDVNNVIVGGASTITLSRVHPGDVPCSWGVRQTISYAALGLKPDQAARIEVLIKYTLHDPAKKHFARLQVGADPAGGILTEKAIWTKEDDQVNWDEVGWKKATLDFDRPPGAVAFTVFFRHRDGELTGKDRHTVRATDPGNRAIADWILIRTVKQ